MSRAGILILILAAGCKQSANLQPFVAAAGSYSLIAASRRPAPPPPAPDGCAEGCKCNGTGRERTGDGLSEVECRCPSDCKCKKKQASVSGTVCTTGTCAGWPPRNTSR